MAPVVNRLLARPYGPKSVTIISPRGAHALACGLDGHLDVVIDGHVGYYCAGMNKHANVTVNGNAGVSASRRT